MAAASAALTGVTTRFVSMKLSETPKQQLQPNINPSWRVLTKGQQRLAAPVRSGVPSTPPGISEKVSESIKQAEEACAGDPVSGECVAAWDEVEELSAAASHARDKLKEEDSDPLEKYCKDNPETDECRTYED